MSGSQTQLGGAPPGSGADPSMEDILASIRRILSEEDSSPPKTGPAAIERGLLEDSSARMPPEVIQHPDVLLLDNSMLVRDAPPRLDTPKPAPPPYQGGAAIPAPPIVVPLQATTAPPPFVAPPIPVRMDPVAEMAPPPFVAPPSFVAAPPFVAPPIPVRAEPMADMAPPPFVAPPHFIAPPHFVVPPIPVRMDAPEPAPFVMPPTVAKSEPVYDHPAVPPVDDATVHMPAPPYTAPIAHADLHPVARLSEPPPPMPAPPPFITAQNPVETASHIEFQTPPASAAPHPPQPESPDMSASLSSHPTIASTETTSAAAGSISNLVRALTSDRAAQVSSGGPTIADIVREEMRPMLKSWLDTNLPPMVERMVRSEIDRVIARAAL